jgi:hypothetical protein
MTTNTDKWIRGAFFLAGLPFLYFVLTKTEPNWIYYVSLSLIFAGIVYGMIADWRMGKKEQVKKRLMIYAAVIILVLVLGYFLSK